MALSNVILSSRVERALVDRGPARRRTQRGLAVDPRAGLPRAIGTKLYKTAQTRGADQDEIFQNRVLRNSTVLIPLGSWNAGRVVPPEGFENGFVVLARPHEYFGDAPPAAREDLPGDLRLGENLLVFYETREQWTRYNPRRFRWTPAISRTPPLRGQYAARFPATTREGDVEMRAGFADSKTGGQGAGIRVYEYASRRTFEDVRCQLAYLAWRTQGIDDLARREGTPHPQERREAIDRVCHERGLDDLARLETGRVLRDGLAVCPLCLGPISAAELATFVRQAEGRGVPDLTITTANLFHVRPLLTGEYNHHPYNVGWGHHRCNTAVADLGIDATLEWMRDILARNRIIA